MKFEDEKIEEIGQWQTASYVIKLGQGLTQWDLRACCTSATPGSMFTSRRPMIRRRGNC